MKKLFFLFLGTLAFVWSGCNKKTDDIEFGRDVPAIVGYDYVNSLPLLITAGETLHAPELRQYLAHSLLKEDDVILADFLLNNSRQTMEDYRTVTNLDYWKLGVTSPVTDGEDDNGRFTPVEDMFLYDMIIHDRMCIIFAGFKHSSYFRDYDYEMTYDPDEAGLTPTISLRAKTRGAEYQTKVEYWQPYAFSMYDFLMSLERDSENRASFNLRYKTDEDSDGNEVWENWKYNPVSIPF